MDDAQNTAGTYKVTATSVVRPDLNGSGTITVRSASTCTPQSVQAALDGSYDVIPGSMSCRLPNGEPGPFDEFLNGGGSLNLTDGVMTFSDGIKSTTGPGNYSCSGFGFSSSPPASGASTVSAINVDFSGQLRVNANLALESRCSVSIPVRKRR